MDHGVFRKRRTAAGEQATADGAAILVRVVKGKDTGLDLLLLFFERAKEDLILYKGRSESHCSLLDRST